MLYKKNLKLIKELTADLKGYDDSLCVYKKIIDLHEKTIGLNLNTIAVAKRIKATQSINATVPGVPLIGWHRGSEGYTNPEEYPDHVVISNKLFNTLESYINNLTEYSFGIFETTEINKKYCFSTNDFTAKEVLLSRDFLELLMFREKDEIDEKFNLNRVMVQDYFLFKSMISLIGDHNQENVINKLFGNKETYLKCSEYINELQKKYITYLDQKKITQKKINIQTPVIKVKPGDEFGNKNKIMQAIAHCRKEGAKMIVFAETIAQSYVTFDLTNNQDFLSQQNRIIKSTNRQIRDYFLRDFSLYLWQNLFSYSKNANTNSLSQITLDNYKEVLSGLNLDPTDKRSKAFLKIINYTAENDIKELKNDDIWMNTENPINADLKNSKQARLAKFMKDTFIETNIDNLNLAEVLEDNSKYDELFGVAAVVPAVIPRKSNLDGSDTYGEFDYNGMYIFRADGSLAGIVTKQRLAMSDPPGDGGSSSGAYFNEERIYAHGDPNKHNVIDFMGNKIGLFICEDTWQESKHHIGDKLVFSQGGEQVDPRMEGHLNKGADILVNTSASPERNIEPNALSSHATDFANLPENTLIIDNILYNFTGNRNDTRRSLLGAVSKKLNRPYIYTNSLGALDFAVMGGGAVTYDRQGNLVGSTESYKDFSIMEVNFSDSGKLEVSGRNKGDLMQNGSDQMLSNIEFGILGYLQTNNIKSVVFIDEGDIQSELFLKILKRVETSYNQQVAENILMEYQAKGESIDNKKVQQAIKREFINKSLSIMGITALPALKPAKFVKQLVNGVRNKIKYNHEIQFRAIFMPQSIAEAAVRPIGALVTGAIGSAGGALMNQLIGPSLSNAFSISFVHAFFFLFASGYILWPAINSAFKSSRTLANRLGIKNKDNNVIDAAMKNAIEREDTIKELSDHKDAIEAVQTTAETTKNDRHSKRHTQYLYNALASLEEHYRNLFEDSYERLVGYIALQEMGRRNAKTEQPKSLFLSPQTRNENNRAAYALGGYKGLGFKPFKTISEAAIDFMYIYELQKELAEKGGFRNEAKFNKALKKIANSDVGTGKVKALLRQMFPGFYLLSKKGELEYKIKKWQEIAEIASSNNNQKRLDKINKKIDNLQKRLNKITTEKSTKKAPELKKVSNMEYWSIPSRKNNIPPSIRSELDKYIINSDLQTLALLKYKIDPDNFFRTWENYINFIVREKVRIANQSFMNQNANDGPALTPNTTSHFQRPISEEKPKAENLLKQMNTYVNQIEEILISDYNDLESVTSSANNTVLILNEDQNFFVERTDMIYKIEQSLIRLKLEAEVNNKNAILIIDNLDSHTDKYAYKYAKEHGIEIVILSNTSSLGGLGIIDNITALENLYIFETEEQKQNFYNTVSDNENVNIINFHNFE